MPMPRLLRKGEVMEQNHRSGNGNKSKHVSFYRGFINGNATDLKKYPFFAGACRKNTHELTDPPLALPGKITPIISF
jgi:hypothetical protein